MPRLQTALDHAANLTREIEQTRSTHLFTSSSGEQAARSRWQSSTPSEPTTPVRLRDSVIDKAIQAWPNKRDRIAAINAAILSAANREISANSSPSNTAKTAN